jgi:membrane-associated phospholipid phosphatase
MAPALAVSLVPDALAAAPVESSAPAAPERVPLDANFSRLELVTTGVVTVTGITLLGLSGRLFDIPPPSFGPPAEGSFDRIWADRLYRDDGSGDRFLGGVPDVAGLFVLPYLPGLLYGLDLVADLRGGGPRLSNDRHALHRLVAYTEALGWTALAVGVTKVLVGRQRPYMILDHPELAGNRREQDLSFFSSHSAVMFAAASFVALDVSRRLAYGPMEGWSPVPRWLLSHALPYFLAFGAACLVAVSRVIDQQHWPTDVLVGAGVGAGIAHAAYLSHFDDHGNPQTGKHRRGDNGPSVSLVPTVRGAAGVALVGTF